MAWKTGSRRLKQWLALNLQKSGDGGSRMLLLILNIEEIFFLSEGREEYHVDFCMWLILGDGEILGE